VAGVLLWLVLIGKDLGTALVIIAILFGLLFFAGAPLRVLAGLFAVGGVLVGYLALTHESRVRRFTSWLDPQADTLNAGWQAMHGRFALAEGGWWGRGLGASRVKWGALPEAHNDFIFAVVGEELGLVGTVSVLGLFALLCYAILRVALRTRDCFVRLAAAGVFTWIAVQALVNIGAVIGVLPVIGLPLPLVSYGGSALLPTMVALGMLLSFARREQGAAEALAARGPGPVRRLVRRGAVSVLSVVLAGGGSAGHVAPLLATADCLRRHVPDVAVVALGTAEGLETRLVPERGYDLEFVPRVPLPRKPTPELVRLPGRLTAAVNAAAAVIDRVRADVVVGFGGYVSAPAYLAARRRRVPLVVHEANARPGWANRLGARLTRSVAVTFPGTALPHAVRTGMPLRREITALDRAALRAEARAAFGLDPQLPTLLVFGGSLGAQRLNETFAACAGTLGDSGVQVLHVSGLNKEFPSPAAPGSPPYVVVPYVDRMDLAYAAADAVACRAGAGTVSEITALGLPAVYVPLPIGNGEQALNARPVVAAGGGLLVDDARCTPDWVRSSWLPVLSDHGRLETMGAAAAGFGRPDADERLVAMVLAAAGGSEGRLQ
jgi:UDP-N-acetylglucosamine--N-acetylmuramyl-(pentapeptide) pyrophosphoryl-undecaprenol N-acetylglucosamine transferase